MINRRRAVAAVLTLLLVAIALLALVRPPAASQVGAPSWQPRSASVVGGFHVHTDRSDGAGSLDDVAASAAQAGLRFVVIADHGDGTRTPDPPAYRSGVLVIDGVEISTGDGHYTAIGMGPAPEPLIGSGRDIVQAVARLGGFGVVSHGDSMKDGLEWRAWDADVDGLEWANLDSAWRAAPRLQLARAMLTYWLRKPEALASIMARPGLLDRFDTIARERRVVTIGATDAHGSLPSYEACLRTISTRVELDAPPSGDAAADARAIVAALGDGHHYSVIDALARPAAFEFVGRAEAEWAVTGRTARQGDALPGGGRVTLEARVAAPAGATMVLLKDGQVLRETRAESLIFGVGGERAAYRVEVRLADAPGNPPVPWIVSNPIFVGY